MYVYLGLKVLSFLRLGGLVDRTLDFSQTDRAELAKDNLLDHPLLPLFLGFFVVFLAGVDQALYFVRDQPCFDNVKLYSQLIDKVNEDAQIELAFLATRANDD